MKTLVSLLSVAIVAGAIGFLSANFISIERGGMQESMVVSSERQPLYWVAPMDSNFRRDAPGLSPMGMDLIPVYEEPDGETNAVRVAATIQQNLGLRTARAVRTVFARNVEADIHVGTKQRLKCCTRAQRAGWKSSTWPVLETRLKPVR